MLKTWKLYALNGRMRQLDPNAIWQVKLLRIDVRDQAEQERCLPGTVLIKTADSEYLPTEHIYEFPSSFSAICS